MYVSSVKIDDSLLFYCGIVFFIVGILICATSVASFALPNINGLNINGIINYQEIDVCGLFYLFS